jgi:4-hydroxy-3-methylbut-2-enyl diphosphate reductase
MRAFDIPDIYKSNLIAELKNKRKKEDPLKKDFTPSSLTLGARTFIIPRHFGFCFGVENAIERAYRAVRENPGKRIFLLSQMIHNPVVNKDLEENGIRFLQDTKGNELHPIDDVTADDVVLIPAFGTTVDLENILNAKGVDLKSYNTTCPFVEKVWKRSAKLGEGEHTILIHGKPSHEETRATFSQANKTGKALVLKDMAEAKLLGEMVLNQSFDDFDALFSHRASAGFDPKLDMKKIGVVNQTTMLAEDTQAIADYFKTIFTEIHGEEVKNFFADTRDTLCYATNDNQTSTYSLLDEKADVAIVVGGYNSSNTSHLVELLEKKFETYFVKGPEEFEMNDVHHFDMHQKKVVTTAVDWSTKNTVIVTSGASCPDSLLEDVIRKIAEL